VGSLAWIESKLHFKNANIKISVSHEYRTFFFPTDSGRGTAYAAGFGWRVYSGI
jgi:hypothetical protein